MLLAKTADGFNIASERAPCSNPESHYCAAGDGRFYVLIRGQGDNGTLSGHKYYFQAGDTNNETGVDQQQLKNILTSFKVK